MKNSDHICERVVEAAKYLEEQGMTIRQLRMIHHSLTRPETFRSTFQYFGTNKELRPVNVHYANRLMFIAEQRRLTGSDI